MNWFIGIIFGTALVVLVVALCCTLIIAGRSDEQANMENNEGADEEMFFKKQICPKCKTGKHTYDLDPKSEVCPHIGCWNRNKCHFYEPLDKPSKKGIFKRNKNKVNGFTSRKF